MTTLKTITTKLKSTVKNARKILTVIADYLAAFIVAFAFTMTVIATILLIVTPIVAFVSFALANIQAVFITFCVMAIIWPAS